MSGGAAPKRKGKYGEDRVRAVLQAAGWWVHASWGSLGPWDLLALRPGSLPAMVQVKYVPPTGRFGGTVAASISPEDRARLVRLAERAGAQAIAARYHGAEVEWARLHGPATTDSTGWSPDDE